jgi:isochorismate synthase
VETGVNDGEIYRVWNDAVTDGGAVALWRLPYSDEIYFIADMAGRPAGGLPELESSGFGFAVSPFVNFDGAGMLFLRADRQRVFSAADLMKPGGVVDCHYRSKVGAELSCSRKHFIEMVERGLSAIGRGELEKVVPSRTMEVALAADFNPILFFAELGRRYPSAFVSLVSMPGIGTWAGASPELLVESSAEKFRTVSLAGTQSCGGDVDLSAAAWCQKEIEEQAMVGRYIVEQFKSIRLREFTETGPETVRAGSMIHLKSEYSVDLLRVDFPHLGSEMLRLLHPTSAVCGMPRKPACDFIVENESVDRELYSGYLGPVNCGGVSRLYVNLRCMQIFRGSGLIYAGAGVTHSSDPGREWDETTLKCGSLLDIIES